MSAQKYALVGTSGNLLGFYDSVLSPPPTSPAAGTAVFAITNAQWAQWMGNQSLLLVSGALTAPAAPALVPALQASNLRATGLALTSTSDSSLNGTYACDDESVSHIQSEMLAILVTGKFADGTGNVAWPDVNGTLHTFPSTASFQAFALAVAAFVASVYKVTNGSSTTLPAASATIP